MEWMNLCEGMYLGFRPLTVYRKQLSAHRLQWAQTFSHSYIFGFSASRIALMSAVLIWLSPFSSMVVSDWLNTRNDYRPSMKNPLGR
jgi:hypothetical protein